MRRIWVILTAFLGLAAMAAPASADAVFTLNCSSVACGSVGNYGTVTLKDLGSGSSAHVEITVNLKVAGNNFAGTGAGYGFAWNVSGNPDLTTTLIPTDASHPLLPGEIYNTANFAIQNNTDPGFGYKMQPFGNTWMYAIEYTSNGGNATKDNKLIFDVTKAGGLTIANFTADNGFMFAADIWNGPSGPTFVVAAKGIPEPQTWLLFFAGLAGITALIVLQRRRKLARA
jgi:hypothetical protein